jgi:phosphoribosyl 1,2-cyclic phosphodiesterase
MRNVRAKGFVMKLQVISTGSKGNCYVLTAGADILVLDAGVPIRAIIRAVPDWTQICGCLITHEHMDHGRSARELAYLGVNIYASLGTIDALCPDAALNRFKPVVALQSFKVEQFTVLPLDVKHDAAEPLGFMVRYDPTGETLLYATDTYYLPYTFPGVNYWIVECNYIEDVVTAKSHSGEIDAAVLFRLQRSHMSLRRLIDALKQNDLSKTRAIILVHLSNANSDEKQMIESVRAVAPGVEVYAADGGRSYDLRLSPF